MTIKRVPELVPEEIAKKSGIKVVSYDRLILNADVVALAQRFGMLMAEYNQAIGDGKISVNEAKRLLRETLAIQQVLLEMKLNLEEEAS